MFVRTPLTFFGLVFLIHTIQGDLVDMDVVQIKASGKTGLKFRLTGRCSFRGVEPVPVNGVTFSVHLDRPFTKFNSKMATVLLNNDTSFFLTNSKEITKTRFVLTFTAIYTYANKTNRCFPVGFCSQPVRTTTTTTTTTQAPTTSDPTIGSAEYLQNTDMESDFAGNWICHPDCTLENSTDSYTGSLSAKLSNRDDNWKGLSQWVNIIPGRKYMLSGYVKLLDTVDGAMYHTFEPVLLCRNDSGDKKYLKFGTNEMVQPGIWTEVGNIVSVPEGYTQFRVYIQCSGATAEYLVDDMSLREFLDDSDWRAKAENRIEQLRKADVSIRVISPNAMSLPENLTLEVYQRKHKFAFGSVVGAEEIVDTDPTYVKYQDWFYEHFEWGLTGNALKWKPMERVQGDIDYETPTRAINAMKSRGIKVRGHCVFWSVETHVPDWVKPLNATETLEAIETRIDGVITNTSGLLEHWDVNNENLHADFFEQQTGDVNITMEMFRQVHMRDPGTKLFLNDFGIVEDSINQKAWAMKAQAQMFSDAGVPIYGVGIQSHISADFHISVVKARLDKVSEAGLPMWITELSMIEANETKKAQALEDLMTLYFSHPTVEGIILWGFWDGRIWKINATLVEGSDLTPNEAGRAYQRLFKQTWRTQETRNVVDSNPLNFRGFKGEYTAKVKQDGAVLTSEDFVLDDAGATVDITLP